MTNIDAQYIRAMKKKGFPPSCKEIQAHNERLEKIAYELETIRELQDKIKLADEDLTLVHMKGFSGGKEQLQAKVDELTNALKMINKRTSFRAVHPADLLAVNAEVNGISGQALKEVKS